MNVSKFNHEYLTDILKLKNENIILMGDFNVNLINYNKNRGTYEFLEQLFNPLSANPTKWSNTLKQFVGNLPTNCLSVFDHFKGLALKGLITTLLHKLRFILGLLKKQQH